MDNGIEISCGYNHGRLACANMISAMVSALQLLRFAEKAMPTCENSRSTAADAGGRASRGDSEQSYG